LGKKGMNLKSIIKKHVEKLTNTHILRSVPQGIDPVRDIANFLPRYRADIVFDIGANVGQSSTLYLTKFPTSHIYCFEPVSDTFRQLQNNLEGNKRVDCYQLAFGSAKSQGKMVLQGNSDMCSLFVSDEVIPQNAVLTESVDIVTIDEFCHVQEIDRINYLKIDTEGGDLEVLRGAVKMLAEQRIDCVQVEAGMNPGNHKHVPLEFLKEFLESHRYFLFGIYEQVSEKWLNGEPHLRFANLLFISHRIKETNRIEVN
jgi:FkbM family methyltransferase